MQPKRKKKKIMFSLKSFSSGHFGDINAKNCRGGEWSELMTRQPTQAGSYPEQRNSTRGHTKPWRRWQPVRQIRTKCIFLPPACKHTWASKYLQQVKPITKTLTNKQTAHRTKQKNRLPRLEITSADHNLLAVIWVISTREENEDKRDSTIRDVSESLEIMS